MKQLYVLRSDDIAKRAIAFLQTAQGDNELHEVIIQPHVEKRTTDQNSLYWHVVGEIAEFSGHTPAEIHDLIKNELLPKQVIMTVNGPKEITGSTTKVPKRKWSDLIERVYAMSADLFGYTPNCDNWQDTK